MEVVNAVPVVPKKETDSNVTPVTPAAQVPESKTMSETAHDEDHPMYGSGRLPRTCCENGCASCMLYTFALPVMCCISIFCCECHNCEDSRCYHCQCCCCKK